MEFSRMKISEVISHLEKEPGGSFTGVSYDEDDFFVRIYEVKNDTDDPEIIVGYEGGLLFSTCGEEDVFELDKLPEKMASEMTSLNFQPSKDLPEVSGYTADHVAYLLFPELPDPELLMSPQERREFTAKVADMFRERNMNVG